MDRFTCDIADYPDGIVLPIDKPFRWTSADVVRKLKYAAIKHFGKKNLKVGHAGTLDPLATGILLVCIGNATKRAEELQSHDKEYIAGITFGATTASYDLEKEIDRFYPTDGVNPGSISKALEGFLGEQNQVAPLFSAKSVDGVRAYEMARKLYKDALREGKPFDGGDAEGLLRTSRIRINELELLDFKEGTDIVTEVSPCAAGGTSVHTEGASSRIRLNDNSALGLPRARIRIVCSKGTYIRAFARDLGEALGTGAHLDSLIRSRSGDYRIEDALSLETALDLLKDPLK